MTVRLEVGDALHLPLDDESVDAIVCDPPYGLEFMGKEWDAPWKTGDNVTRDAGFSQVGLTDGGDRLPRPSSNGSSNPFCRNCGGSQRGNDRNGFTRCRCDAPDFPNVRAIEGRAFQAWCEAWAREAYRVLKPGGHLVAFGGTRTFHRLTSGLEDAGFEIRDCLSYMYGSGFPKSLDVSKALDREAGAERDRVPATGGLHANTNLNDDGWAQVGRGGEATMPSPVPITDLARQWEGWGTALKPAWEPIVLARKPLRGTVAQNVAAFGTGALNIDASRVGVADDDPNRRRATGENGGAASMFGVGNEKRPATLTTGRWPANVVLGCACGDGAHDPGCAVALLDAQSGERRSAYPGNESAARRYAGAEIEANAVASFGATIAGLSYGDSGGASRFFYTAKASRTEREAGLDDLEPSLNPETESAHTTICAKCNRQRVNRSGACECPDPVWIRQTQRPRRNNHPTVKPVALMRWLVTLVTPPGGVVLDMFMGSGSTGVAAVELGFSFIGFDLDPHYVEIALRRIGHERPMRMALGDAAL